MPKGVIKISKLTKENLKEIKRLREQGWGYGKIAKAIGHTRMTVLAAGRKMQYGMSNTQFYGQKNRQRRLIALRDMKISLPLVRGIDNPKYKYVEQKHVC